MNSSTSTFEARFPTELKQIGYFLDEVLKASVLKDRCEIIAANLAPLLKDERPLASFREEHEHWCDEIKQKYKNVEFPRDLLKSFNWDDLDLFTIYELLLSIESCWKEELLREKTSNRSPSSDSWRVQPFIGYDLRNMLRYSIGLDIVQIRSKEPSDSRYLSIAYARLTRYITKFAGDLLRYVKMNKEYPIYSVELAISRANKSELILIVKKDEYDTGCDRRLRKFHDERLPSEYFFKSLENIGNKIDIRDLKHYNKKTKSTTAQSITKVWGAFPEYLGELLFEKVDTWTTILRKKIIILKNEKAIDIKRLEKEVGELKKVN